METLPDPRKEYWHKMKHKLGIFRIPLGVFFLILSFLLIITPLTPGSMVTLFIGLELLDLREKVYERVKNWRRK